jgi:hypothetical protein
MIVRDPPKIRIAAYIYAYLFYISADARDQGWVHNFSMTWTKSTKFPSLHFILTILYRINRDLYKVTWISPGPRLGWPGV